MLDVVVLFFLFGLLAGLVRSELKLPPALYDTLSLFLLLTIGLKGGVGLAQQSLLPLLPQLALVILLGMVQTLLGFALLRIKMNRIDAAATAAHYGSVSVATFAVGVNWLTERGIDFESQLSIFLAVMEMGFLCPPAGMNIFFASAMFAKPIREVAVSVLPALLAIFLGALVISWVPEIATWLPGVLAGR